MATYDSYKDSGVKWLGKIPSHWEMCANTTFLQEQKKNVGRRKDLDLLSLTLNGVIFRDKESGEGKMPSSFENYKIVSPNDIIFCLFDIDETPRTVGVAKQTGMITGAYDVFKVNDRALVDYIYYYYLSIDYCKALKPYYTGLRKTIKPTTFKHIITPIPPLNEQEAIVSYLDKVTADIDKAIEAQQKMIEALNERKQIIITRAVTRGLNPDAPLKDSGIDWLGQIPEHWERICLKYLGDARNGLTYSPGDLVDNGRLVIRSSNIKDNRLSFNDNAYVKDFPYKFNIKLGDIIICSRNGSASLVGKSIYIEKDIDATFGAFMLRFRPNRPSKFWHYALQSCIAAYKALFSTSTINQLTVSTFRHMVIALPPESEQQNIVVYLDLESKKLDSAISNCEQTISLLQERKQIIINEVVTGKKKVI